MLIQTFALQYQYTHIIISIVNIYLKSNLRIQYNVYIQYHAPTDILIFSVDSACIYDVVPKIGV